ncbi:MAG TPA: SIR2 family protein [Polyangia bacterium]|jgi:tetratricopeptide (TPR) repeat protein
MSFEIPESLVERLRRRQCVLCAGLGLGQAAGLDFPGWRSLGQKLSDWYEASGKAAGGDLEEIRRVAADGDASLAVAYVARKLGSDVVCDLLRDAYAEPADAPELYQMLVDLPFRGVLTTGYDGLLGRTFGVGRDGGPAAFLPGDAAALKAHRGKFLLAAHGDPGRPETLVLGQADLRRLLANGSEYRAFCEDLFGRRSLVFVGFQAGDPDLRALLERHFGTAGPTETPHYLVCDGVPPLVADDLKAAYGVEVVPAGGDLADFVEELRERVKAEEAAARPDDDDLVGWLEVLAADPQSGEAVSALAALEKTLQAEQAWDKLIDLLLGRLEHETERDGRLAHLREVARIFEQEVGDLGKAFTALQAALRESPDDDEITGELERLAEGTGLWNELVADYAQLIQGTTGEKAAAHWLRLGQWYDKELGHREYAVSSYKQALALDPKLAGAYDALGDALYAGERFDELEEMVVQHVGHETEPAKLVELWLLVADLQETRLGRPADAIASYLKALELEPDSGDALAALERVYRKQGHWRDLAGLLEKRANLALDPASAAALRHEVGELRAERLDDLPGAIGILEAVLADHPGRVATLRTLEKLYDRGGRVDDYLRTLERMVEAVDSDDERLLLLRRLAAELEDKDGGVRRAIECLERVLTIAPSDLEAYRGLARLLRREGRLPDLADLLGRHLAATDAPAQRRELYEHLGRLYEEELGDVAHAVDAYENLAGLPGDADAALAALTRLHERAGDHAKVAETALRRAENQTDLTLRADLIAQAALVAAKHLHDEETAERQFAKALELAPGHLPSLTGLMEVYRGRGDYLRAAKLMTEAEAETQNRLEKTRLLHEAGCLYQDRLDDPARAEEHFARALAIDPEHVEAGLRVADLYTAGEKWSQLEPVLEMLARKVDADDKTRLLDIHSRLAVAATKLDNPEKAIRAYNAAFALDPTSLQVLAGLGGLLFAQVMAAPPRTAGAPDDDAVQAIKLYQALLHHHFDALSRPEQLDVYGRLGQLNLRLGERDRALNFFQKALAIEPDHKQALVAAIEILRGRGEFTAVVEHERTLAAAASDEEQARLLEDIGDIYFDKLEDPIEAAAAYQAALDGSPRKRTLLSKLLDLYSQQKAWQKAVEVVAKLCDLEQDAAKRAKYHYTAAVLCRDELKDDEHALEHFNKALDDAPDMTKAFEAQEKLLTRNEDWKNLARAYRRMIKRLPPEGLTDLRLKLWQGLGEIALNRIGDSESAVAAFEVAATLDPKNPARQETLAELYLKAGPDYLDKAIGAQQAILARTPERLGQYRTLRKLYGETKQLDKMWCLCGALVFLKKADAEEQRFYEQMRPKTLVPARRKITEDLWQRAIMHPDEDRVLAATFGRLAPAVALLKAQAPENFGLKKKERAELTDERPIVKLFRYACQTLDLTPPDLYLRDGAQPSVQVANTAEKGALKPALVFSGPTADKLRERESLFELGKRLAFLRPERFLRYAWPTAGEIECALRGMLVALQLPAPPPPPGLDAAEPERIAQALRKVFMPQVFEPLAQLARKWLAGRTQLEMTTWLGAVDLTASRVGFILTNDFETAARLVSKEPPQASPLAAKDRLKHLLGYSCSEEYFTVRRHLGIEIEVQR